MLNCLIPYDEITIVRNIKYYAYAIALPKYIFILIVLMDDMRAEKCTLPTSPDVHVPANAAISVEKIKATIQGNPNIKAST